jgi:hypothetical protein
MARFVSVVLIGLGFNTLLVWCFVYQFSIHPAAAKIVAVPVVLIWNYLGRRLFVFSEDIPVAMQGWLRRARPALGELALASAACRDELNDKSRRAQVLSSGPRGRLPVVVPSPPDGTMSPRCHGTPTGESARVGVHAPNGRLCPRRVEGAPEDTRMCSARNIFPFFPIKNNGKSENG